MNGLKAAFADRVDFIALNVDIMETMPIREQFNMVQRSQYTFIDPVGNIVQQWYGFLDEASVAQSIRDYLATTG